MVSATSSPEVVREITGSELPDQTLQTFVDAASILLDGAEACLTASGRSLCDMDAACTYLAAHLLTTSAVGASSGVKKMEKFEGWTVEYVIGEYVGSGLLATPYGATANAMTGGCLQELDKAPSRIGFFV